MDEDLKLLIEQILGRDEKNISFKMCPNKRHYSHILYSKRF